MNVITRAPYAQNRRIETKAVLGWIILRENYSMKLYGLMLAVFAALLATMLAAPLHADDGGGADGYPEGKIKLFGNRYSLAVTGGYSQPASGEFRGLFGGGGPGFGLTLFRPETEITRFDGDFVFKYYAKDGVEAIILGLTGGVHHNFADPLTASAVPFVEVHAGPYAFLTPGYAKAAIPPPPGSTLKDPPGTQITAGANAVFGVELNDSVVLSVRYDYIGKVGGINPSFWSAGVLFKVW